MAGEVRVLEQRKRELIARSQFYRQSMGADLQNIRTATAWVPKGIKAARAIYPILMTAAPVLGFLFSRKRHRGEKNSNGRGLFAKAFAGYRLFRKVKPVWDGFRSWRE
jgi:hypothetical protein